MPKRTGVKLTSEQAKERLRIATIFVRDHFRTTGKRPTASTSHSWFLLEHRLATIGWSISKLCTSQGMPELKRQWTKEDIVQEVQAFAYRHGRAPIADRDPGFKPMDRWLRRRGTSLSWLCASLGYQSSNGGDRSKARQEAA